ELMPQPGPHVADGEVQAAALSALRAESLARPPAPPSPADASSARAASRAFTPDVDEPPPPPPNEPALAGGGDVVPFADDDPGEATRPYAPSPYFGAGGDVVVSVRDISAPTRRGPEVSIAPIEVSPDEVELRALDE